MSIALFNVTMTRLQVMSFSINHQTINSDSSGPFWAFAAAQICDGKPGGDTQVKDIFKFLSLFYNKFWFFLICPSCALSEFQVSDRKVPCFNRRSRQCELDSIMLFCIDNDRFPQSAKKNSNICIKYLNQKLQTGETGTSHLKLIHNPSCWVCLNV